MPSNSHECPWERPTLSQASMIWRQPLQWMWRFSHLLGGTVKHGENGPMMRGLLLKDGFEPQKMWKMRSHGQKRIGFWLLSWLLWGSSLVNLGQLFTRPCWNTASTWKARKEDEGNIGIFQYLNEKHPFRYNSEDEPGKSRIVPRQKTCFVVQ